MQGKQITQIVLGAGCVALGTRMLTIDTSMDSKSEAMGYKLIGLGAICIGAGNIFLALRSNGGGGDGDDDEVILPDPDGGDEVEPSDDPSELHLEDGVPDTLDELLVGSDNG